LHDHVREHRYAMVLLGTLVVLWWAARPARRETVGLVAESPR
jgi:hypothetical protein